MFGKIVRFDDEDNSRRPDDSSAPALPPRSSPPPVIAQQHNRGDRDRLPEWEAAPASAAPSHVTSGASDGRWVEELPDTLRLMYDSALQERARAMAELHRLAQSLCHDEWDGQSRGGKDPERWPPSQIAGLVIRSVEKKLRSARFSQDPQLAERYQQVAAELAQAKAEMDGLRQRLHSAETAVREMKADALKEAMRKQKYAEEKAQTGYVKQRVSSPPPAPRAPVAAPRAVVVDAPPVVVGTDADAESDEDVAPEKSNERRDDVVRVLASTGLCRGKDVRSQLAKLWKMRNDKTAQKHVLRVVADGFAEVKEANLEWGGKATGHLFTLTAQGRNLAKSLGVQLVKGQYERGMALHKSADHLYLILEVADILSANGYRDVAPFPPSMTLSGDKQYQPDIKARMPSPENTIIQIEVERNTYKATDRDDRFGKWLRAAEAGLGVIHLITPNNESLAAIVAEIDAVRKQTPQQRIQIKAFSVSDFRAQKATHGTGIVWVAQIGSGAFSG